MEFLPATPLEFVGVVKLGCTCLFVAVETPVCAVSSNGCTISASFSLAVDLL